MLQTLQSSSVPAPTQHREQVTNNILVKILHIMKTKFDMLYMFHKNFSFLLKTTQINFKIRDSISRQSENLLRILIDDFNSHTVIVDSCSIIVCLPWPTIALLLNIDIFSNQLLFIHLPFFVLVLD